MHLKERYKISFLLQFRFIIYIFNPFPIYLLHPPTTESSEGVSLQLGNSKDFILSLDIKFISNGSVSVILETTEKGPPFTIHYVTGTQLIAFKDREITYGIGPRTVWSTLTRDLLTDLRKGVGLSNTKAVKATKVGLLKKKIGAESTLRQNTWVLLTMWLD